MLERALRKVPLHMWIGTLGWCLLGALKFREGSVVTGLMSLAFASTTLFSSSIVIDDRIGPWWRVLVTLVVLTFFLLAWDRGW